VTNADVVAGEKIERVRVTGYGWNDHPLTAMYAQATAIGGLVGRKAVGAGGELVVEHMVDTQPGDSGAPIIVIKDVKAIPSLLSVFTSAVGATRSRVS
jgi:V8-like Glu-specific endopeptidase